MRKIYFVVLLALLLSPLAVASPNEAVGRVTKVVDGDTIDVQLQSHDSRISEDTIRVRLADLDSPEMKTPQGPTAKAYTTKWLQSAGHR
jgi:micrococcal nuclease